MTSPCTRRAWLTLGALSVDLESYDGGYFCQSLDLGYPEVRDVTANRPDQHGLDDQTQYFGGRTIDAQITALSGAGATIDAVAATFAPFMDPAARPTLHYVLDRPGAPERILTNLRAAGYGWPIVGAYQRDIQLQWVASDPIPKDPATKTATAWAGSSAPPGRSYPLTFNRIYPPGSAGPMPASFNVAGDVPVRPLLRIYGPATRPSVFFSTPIGTPYYQYTVYTTTATTIPAGQWIDIDLASKVATWNSDPASSAAANVDWSASSWPVLTPGRAWRMSLNGTTTSGVTQVQATWQEGYLV